MFCPKCGAKLPDGSRFCSACGNKLAETDAASSIQKKNAEEPSEAAAKAQAEGVSERAQEPGAQAKGSEEETLAAKPSAAPEAIRPEKEKAEEAAAREKQFVPVKTKNRAKRKWLLCAAAAAVVICAVLAAKEVIGRLNSDKNTYVYLSDGSYHLFTDLKKGEAFEMASSKGGPYLSENIISPVKFSDDGKYIYYFTKCNRNTYTGTLCRAEYKRLKENSSKNDKYIQIIASNVSIPYELLPDGAVVYLNGDKTLYYFDGTDSIQISKSVNWYKTDEEDHLIYETDNEEDHTLYFVELSEDLDKEKLISNYSSVVSRSDLKNIVYEKTGEDGSSTLYVTGIGKEPQKLAEHVDEIEYNDIHNDNEFFYTADSGASVNLYDYVEDTYEAADAKLSEPDREDYRIPTYSYYNIYRSDTISSQDELYTSCTRPVNFYYNFFTTRSLEYAAENDSEHRADYQAFVSKYKPQENEDGYLLVTDEVREDLIALAQACGDGQENQWMRCCFWREMTGTTYDDESYGADYQVYAEAKKRMELREALKDPENAFAVKALYCFKDGVSTLISDKVLSAELYPDCALYNTTDMLTEKLEIDKAASIYDVASLFDMDYEAQNYIVPYSSLSSSRLSMRAAEMIGEAVKRGSISLWATSTHLAMDTSEGELYIAKIDKGAVEGFSIVSDEAELIYVDTEKNEICYADNIYEDGRNNKRSDLYVYQNGESRRIVQDTLMYSWYQYEDGVILAWTDRNASGGIEITLFDSEGRPTVIADDIQRYIRCEGGIFLYIADGDLHYYDGKEKAMVASDVEYVWSSGEMPCEMISFK